VEDEARRYLDEIDERGGAAHAVEYMQEEIHSASYRFQMEVESGERTVVGVNRFEEDEPSVPTDTTDYSSLEAEQRASVERLRRERDGAAVEDALTRLRQGARGDENLMPLIIDAVRAPATLGEISDALRAEWGMYQPGG